MVQAANLKRQFLDLEHDPYDLIDQPDYHADLVRMRAAVDDWLVRVEDWSEMHEGAMVERFLVDGEVGITSSPVFSIVNKKLSIIVRAAGASLFHR